MLSSVGAAAPPPEPGAPPALPLAPDFALPDSRGRSVSLRAIVTGGPVVVVFFRGHWCPYCRRYLSKLQRSYARLLEHGTSLVAISPEPPATSARLAETLGLTFPLLSDASGETIARYGVSHRLARRGRAVLPHPAVFVIDTGGIIRFQSIDRDFKRRTTMRSILRAVGDLRT